METLADVAAGLAYEDEDMSVGDDSDYVGDSMSPSEGGDELPATDATDAPRGHFKGVQFLAQGTALSPAGAASHQAGNNNRAGNRVTVKRNSGKHATVTRRPVQVGCKPGGGGGAKQGHEGG